MAERYSRRDFLKTGLSVAGALSVGAPRAWGQPYVHRGIELRPRQRPPLSGRAMPAPLPESLHKYLAAAEAAVAEPFKGITTDGRIVPGLFPLYQTGISTQPITAAAETYWASLEAHQQAQALFPVDSDMWRRWSNIHVYLMRHGVSLEEMLPAQRLAALALLRASLSPQGFATARGIMQLNACIGEITGQPEGYGEWLYWLSLMGRPAPDAPWGWQIDGHHLNINCFVLRDQVVMTPMFMGSEPVAATTGPYAGTRVFHAEEQQGLALMQALTARQRTKTILSRDLPGELFATGFRDNVELHYAGIRYGELARAQQGRLRRLIATYVGRMRPDHARVKMAEVHRHLADISFAWMGDFDADSVFYYRIHSPVLLIEFDHQRGVALDNDQPSRHHIHTVVRTPNGNDYGKDLLRQHHEQFDHAHLGHGQSHAEPANGSVQRP